MSSIGKAIGPLVNIALLLLFAVIIFAIIGLEFYAGALNRTCYSLDDLGKTTVTQTQFDKRPFALFSFLGKRPILAFNFEPNRPLEIRIVSGRPA